jgi:hypothetical protein
MTLPDDFYQFLLNGDFWLNGFAYGKDDTGKWYIAK